MPTTTATRERRCFRATYARWTEPTNLGFTSACTEKQRLSHQHAFRTLTVAVVATAWLVGAADSSDRGGKVLYSPDLQSHPSEEAGYPRLIRLAHGRQFNGTLLATLAHSVVAD